MTDLSREELDNLAAHARIYNDDRDKLIKRILAQLERVSAERDALRGLHAELQDENRRLATTIAHLRDNPWTG
jgi:hypothetical protein